MRIITKFALALLLVAISSQILFAANTAKVTGDIGRDGYLTIDLDWMVDTANYPGMTNDVIRKKVREKMWEKILPELVKKTSGYPVNYDKSNFTKVSENIKLVEKRPNGTNLSDVKIKVHFYCPRYAGKGATVNQATHQTKMEDDDVKYRFVRGI